MAQNQFKTRYLPNADGSESSIALTNVNCAYVHTYLGDDNTGDGTRQKPCRSMVKAILKGKTYILFRGLINEAFTVGNGPIIIGDDINQVILTSNYTITVAPGANGGLSRLRRLTIVGNITSPTGVGVTQNIAGINIDGNLTHLGSSCTAVSSCILKSMSCANVSTDQYITTDISNCTYLSPYVQNKSATTKHRGNIMFGLDTRNVSSNSGEVFNYDIIIAYSPLMYNGVCAVIPAYTDDPIANVTLFKNAMLCAGYSSAWISGHIPLDSFGNETNKVVKELRMGGTHPNIFNDYYETLTGALSAAITAGTTKNSITLTVSDSSKWPTTGWVFMPTSADYTANGITMPAGSLECYIYSSVTINSTTSITLNGSYTFKAAHAISSICTRYGDVKGFGLNPDSANTALWSSATGGYCGASLPAYDSIQSNMTSIVVVDESTGIDTAIPGDLVYFNSDGELVFNNISTQTWNRFRDSSTIKIELGSTFKGGGGRSTDGSPFGYYIGKKQNLIGATKYYSGDALTVGKWYKVFNDTAISVSNAIIYNSVQYLPEYTFCCVTGVTTFSLLNAGTGTYVMEIIADVLESIEIIPYDDVNTESSFPKFSCPINGDCKLLYYTAAGATRYGKTAGNPVLFADLAVANMITDFGNISNKISYYDSWAISNADQEFFVLGDPTLTSPRSTYFTTAIPNIRYFRRSINAHFDKPYDY